MRRPRARFTVRRLMIVVATAAALFAAFEAGRRWERSREAPPPTGKSWSRPPVMEDVDLNYPAPSPTRNPGAKGRHP